jgi:hypothetical protein
MRKRKKRQGQGKGNQRTVASMIVRLQDGSHDAPGVAGSLLLLEPDVSVVFTTAHIQQLEAAQPVPPSPQPPPPLQHTMRWEFSGPPSHKRLAFPMRAPETGPACLHSRRASGSPYAWSLTAGPATP